jgi:hypothetical protein
MEIVDSNRGRMYVSGQHNPMSWDSLMVGLYLIAEKLGKDPIEIATLNLHGPESQTDPNPVPSYEACVAAVKKMMDWSWHPAGATKLFDGRMHGASFRYNQCPRHSVSGYNCKLELRNGVVHLASKGPIIGHYSHPQCDRRVGRFAGNAGQGSTGIRQGIGEETNESIQFFPRQLLVFDVSDNALCFRTEQYAGCCAYANLARLTFYLGCYGRKQDCWIFLDSFKTVIHPDSDDSSGHNAFNFH